MTPTFTTLQSCPSCGSPMVPHVLPACHDRPGLSFLRCVDCGVEDGHRIDPATPSIASPGRATTTKEPVMGISVTTANTGVSFSVGTYPPVPW